MYSSKDKPEHKVSIYVCKQKQKIFQISFKQEKI